MSSLWISFLILLRFATADDYPLKCDGATIRPPSENTRLLNCLFENYDRNNRPVKQESETVMVKLELYIGWIYLNSYYHVLVVSNWAYWEWDDKYLVWNPDEYGQISEIRVSSEDIWVPDVTVRELLPQGGASHHKSIEGGRCFVHSTGHVTCFNPAEFNAYCYADLTKWPYDEQECFLALGSWAHATHYINTTFHGKGFSLEQFIPDREWELLDVSVRYENWSQFRNVYYDFRVRRHNGIEVAVVIAPAIILALVTVFTLLISPKSWDRFVLTLVDVICHILSLEETSYLVPHNGASPPRIVLFYRDSLLLCGISLCLGILSRAFQDSSVEVPQWVVKRWYLSQESTTGMMVIELLMGKRAGNEGKFAWTQVMQFVDRLCSVVFTIVYMILFLALMT